MKLLEASSITSALGNCQGVDGLSLIRSFSDGESDDVETFQPFECAEGNDLYAIVARESRSAVRLKDGADDNLRAACGDNWRMNLEAGGRDSRDRRAASVCDRGDNEGGLSVPRGSVGRYGNGNRFDV